MPTSRLITAITAALQAKIGAFWMAQGFPGSAPTITDMEGALSAMFDTTLPDVIQPLSGAPSGNVVYNTIPVGPQIYRIFIPAAYLVAASGGPYTLTLGTGSGTTVVVQIAAAGSSVPAFPLLFSIYVDPSGNVYSDHGEAALFAPLPQSAAGVGQAQWLVGSSGAALSTPAGGEWQILSAFYNQNASNGLYLATASVPSEFLSGGSQILVGVAGYTPIANIYRVS